MKIENVSLDHLNLTVRNFAETADWYKRIFGYSVVERGTTEEGPWGVLKNGESMLCVYERPNKLDRNTDESDRYFQIYHFGLRIQDRQNWERTLEREKLKVDYGGPVRYPHSLSWYITDPTGHEIEVVLWDGDQVKFD